MARMQISAMVMETATPNGLKLDNFLMQYQPHTIHRDYAVGLVGARTKAHHDNDLSLKALAELDQLLLKHLVKERTLKDWLRILVAFLHCSGPTTDPQLENCIAMGLQNVDLQVLDGCWKMKLLKMSKDLGPGLRNILTQARQVQDAIQAGWELSL
ncbi:MAG: hypothetical protein Q9209_003654 [Squamulea sp. 1 TL-2023]